MTKERLKELKIKMIEGSMSLAGYKCYKQSVIAMVEEDNLFGSNNVKNKLSVCPRVEIGFASGAGYHICIEKCNGNNIHEHAEISLINEAKRRGISLKNKTIYLLGHTYCCENCLKELREAGVSLIKILLEDSVKTIIEPF
jgi:deoxycytidylate deaminase